MEFHHEDRIDALLLHKVSLLPLFVPPLLLLLVLDDGTAPSLLVMTASLIVPLVGVVGLARMRKPVLAADGTRLAFQSNYPFGRQVVLHNEGIAEIEDRSVSMGGLRGGREFLFRMRDGSEHRFRYGFMPDQLERARALIDRRLPGRRITSSESESATGPHSTLDITVLAVVLGAFMLFTVEYFFLAEEYYADGAPWAWIVGLTAVTTVLVVGLARKHAESGEDFGKIVLMAVVSAGAVSYAVLPRVNRWTDDEGLRAIEYRLDTDRVWRAEDPDLPIFRFGGRSEFWNSIQPGARKTFDLRHGGLGFWQINMKRLYAEQRAFYEGSQG